jgi:octaprenyl-diphosphate synthase
LHSPVTADNQSDDAATDFDPARALVEQALAPVADDLSELSLRISSYVPAETRSAQAVIKHVLTAGGKRIRPALFFMSARMLGYRGDHYFPIAAVTEFVHTASLLHDDVVDNSSLRRGKPTANSIYGDETSVLVGDLIYSTASEMMAATGNMEIVKTFARAIRLMSDGELLQLENLFNPEIGEATYLRILEFKTAILIEAACRSAGLLAGASDERCEALRRFGHSVGMAFQLIDDALDYTGSTALVGKATLSDLVEGKVTMPVIQLLRLLPPAEAERLAEGLRADEISDATVNEVARLVERHDTAERTVERAHVYTVDAMAALATFPPSEHRDVLETLANRLLFRFN